MRVGRYLLSRTEKKKSGIYNKLSAVITQNPISDSILLYSKWGGDASFFPQRAKRGTVALIAIRFCVIDEIRQRGFC